MSDENAKYIDALVADVVEHIKKVLDDEELEVAPGQPLSSTLGICGATGKPLDMHELAAAIVAEAMHFHVSLVIAHHPSYQCADLDDHKWRTMTARKTFSPPERVEPVSDFESYRRRRIANRPSGPSDGIA